MCVNIASNITISQFNEPGVFHITNSDIISAYTKLQKKVVVQDAFELKRSIRLMYGSYQVNRQCG